MNTRPGPSGSGAQILTRLQLIDRLAALVLLPRVHRHRYYGVLAPNSPLRPAVTAMALLAATLAPAALTGHPAPPPTNRPTAAPRYAWALLLARISMRSRRLMGSPFLHSSTTEAATLVIHL